MSALAGISQPSVAADLSGLGCRLLARRRLDGLVLRAVVVGNSELGRGDGVDGIREVEPRERDPSIGQAARLACDAVLVDGIPLTRAASGVPGLP